MSFNRENVIWRSTDGNWYRGFFAVEWTGDDPEWDVDYDYDSFTWVSGPHPTERSAEQSWHGANPGGWDVVTDEPGATALFDAMFTAAKKAAAQARR